MTSEDITFCAKHDCPVLKCDRNPKNIKQYWLDHSYAMFADCKYFGAPEYDIYYGGGRDPNESNN